MCTSSWLDSRHMLWKEAPKMGSTRRSSRTRVREPRHWQCPAGQCGQALARASADYPSIEEWHILGILPFFIMRIPALLLVPPSQWYHSKDISFTSLLCAINRATPFWSSGVPSLSTRRCVGLLGYGYERPVLIEREWYQKPLH